MRAGQFRYTFSNSRTIFAVAPLVFGFCSSEVLNTALESLGKHKSTREKIFKIGLLQPLEIVKNEKHKFPGGPIQEEEEGAQVTEV